MEGWYHVLYSLHHQSSPVLYFARQFSLIMLLTFTIVNKTNCSSSFGRVLHRVEYLFPIFLPFPLIGHTCLFLLLNLKIFFYLINLIYLFIKLFLAVLSFRCCLRVFSSCGAQASHCGGFSCHGAGALGTQASVVAMHRLNCPLPCGIFLDWG